MSASNRPKIQSIIRFGSKARGDDTPTSDDDVLVFAGEVDDPVAIFQFEVCCACDVTLVCRPAIG